MTYDKNLSPVNWYLVSYLLRFIELDDPRKDDDEARFMSWENTILVNATSLGHAYEKGVKVARANAKPYQGGRKAVPVQWKLVGITQALPVYEALEDERAPRKLKTLKQMVGPKRSFFQ
jgi:hypothetical protein